MVQQRGGGGLGGSTGILESSMQDWKFVLGVNVVGVIHTLKAFVPLMRAQREHRSCVITTSSVAGIVWSGMGPCVPPFPACSVRGTLVRAPRVLLWALRHRRCGRCCVVVNLAAAPTPPPFARALTDTV